MLAMLAARSAERRVAQRLYQSWHSGLQRCFPQQRRCFPQIWQPAATRLALTVRQRRIVFRADILVLPE